jgi:hypothetical protein
MACALAQPALVPFRPPHARASYAGGMYESVAGLQAWTYLQDLGCSRSVHELRVRGTIQYCVVIVRGGKVIAFGSDEQRALANSIAILDAMQLLRSTFRMN